MKVLSTEGLTKLIQLIKGSFISVNNTETINEITLADVATSGDYDDLSNKPTIPTVNNATLTIQKNGTTVNTFTANASSDVTANITVPTDTSDLTNGAGFITNTDYATASVGGVVKVGSVYGTNINNGYVATFKASDSDIGARTHQYRPIVPANLNLAVKTGVTNNGITLTNAEQQNAMDWLGVKSYITSRGENLVTNGFASLGNNYNFASFIYSGSDTYGAGGCFTKTSDANGSRGSIISGELMPVDITQSYKLSYAVKNTTSTSTYDYINMYDIDGYVIAKGNVDFVQGTTTTLAQDLKDGDTKVYLTNISSSWHTGQPGTTSANYYRSLIFWNYTNSYGYTYPVEYYSRNWWFDIWNDDNDVDAVNGVITLKSAWNHGTFPAGTSVSQGTTSGGYVYGNANYIPTAGEWTEKSFIFTPDRFRNGTSYIRLGWLYNYSQQPNNVFKISSISLTQNLSIKDAMTSESYATSTVGGVVKVLSTYGTNINNGYVTTFKASNADIDAKTHQYRPIVPYNLDYAVKTSITTNANTLTDAEKSAAQSWLGIDLNGKADVDLSNVNSNGKKAIANVLTPDIANVVVNPGVSGTVATNTEYSYTFPSDGYLHYSLNAYGGGNNNAYVKIVDENNVEYYLDKGKGGTSNVYMPILSGDFFVRQGWKVYYQFIYNNSVYNINAVNFIPLKGI